MNRRSFFTRLAAAAAVVPVARKVVQAESEEYADLAPIKAQIDTVQAGGTTTWGPCTMSWLDADGVWHVKTLELDTRQSPWQLRDDGSKHVQGSMTPIPRSPR